jgi:general secretion pathway protein H
MAQNSARRAFTMVEVLIVVALIALLGGAIVGGTGMLSGSRLRAGATLVMISVRSAVTQANTTGRPARLVFDFDHNRLLLQETRGKMLRVRSEEEGAKAGAEASTDLERAAAEFGKSFAEGPRAPPATFSEVPGFDRDVDSNMPGRELGRGIRFVQVQTEHDSEPRTEGQAYLYFWPGGGTEQAAIQITREGDIDGITVMVNALTGRARLVRGRVELEEARKDSYFDEREEE